MKVKSPLSIDIEGPSATTFEGPITVVSICDRPGRSIALNPEDPYFYDALKTDEIIGANYVLYDAWVLYLRGYGLPRKVWDIRQAGKVLNPDTPNDLFYQASEWADPPIKGYWKAQKDYRDDEALVCMIDTDAAFRVKVGQEAELKRRGQLYLMRDYLQPLSNVVLKMRTKGIRIDRDRLKDVGGVLNDEIGALRKHLPQWGGKGTEQQHLEVQAYLYNVLGLPVMRTQEKKVTANEESLKTLLSYLETGSKKIGKLVDVQKSVEFINNILVLREKAKLYNSFFKRYLNNNEEFVHAELNITGTATLRFSCKSPNLQQVPQAARGIFIPDHPDWEIMSVDLKQAEVIGILWWAEAWDVLKKVLTQGYDAYFYVASKAFGREPSKKERDDFKTTTLAVMYGEDYRTTAKRLGITKEDAEFIHKSIYEILPGIKEYRNTQIQSAGSRGYVEDPFGMRRYLRILGEHTKAANQACNMPVQGIPPKVIGRAMIGMDKDLPGGARMLMQVHDEVVLTYPKAIRKQVIDCVHTHLRSPVKEMPAPQIGMPGGICFNTDLAVGPSWGELEEL